MRDDVDALDEIEAALKASRPTVVDVAARFARAEVLQRSGAPEDPVMLGRFSVERRLGSGGFSVVYVATDPMLEREVALKVIRREALLFDPRGTEGWLAECRALAKLDHPNVVRVFEAGIEDEQPFLVMELLGGGTLRTWYARQIPVWTVVVEHFIEIGRGLVAIHEAGVVHRDFKPDNVLFDAAGSPKVADLGLARGDVGEPDLRGGTPRYMAPEQLAGERATTHSDQYAFFLSMAEALTGKDPAALRVAQGGIEAPRWVRRTIRRGLASEPEDRWPDLAAALGQLEAGMRRRRRAWVVGSSVLVAGLAVVVGVAAAVETPCKRSPPSWSEATKARLEAAVVALDRPHAEATWTAIERRLDAYAEQLSVAHCEPVPEALEQRSAACFEHLEASFADLVGVLEEPTPALVDDALTAVFSLTPVSHCTDPRRLSSNAALAEPERWSAVAAQLRAAKRQFILGDLPAARQTAQEALRMAESFDDDGLRARALLPLGQYVARSGELERAVGLWQEAYWAAVEVSDDHVAATSSQLIGRQVGANLHRIEDGLVWTRTAQAWNGRIEATPLEQVGTHDATGAVLLAAGRFDEALREYEAALRALEEAEEPRPLRRAPIVTSRGQALLGLGRMDEARTAFEEALALLEGALGPHHPLLQRPLGGLASIAGDEDPQRALALTQRALQIARSTHGDEHPDVAVSMANVGIMLEGVGRMTDAAEHLETALAQMRRYRHPMLGQVLDVSAGLLAADGRLDQAAARHAEATEALAESVGEAHPLYAAALRHWADTADAQGDRESAAAKKRRAVAILEDALGAEHPDVQATRRELVRLEDDLR